MSAFTASLRRLPPDAYWEELEASHPTALVADLRAKSDLRWSEFSPTDFPPPEAPAEALLERLVDDGWLERRERVSCPNDHELGAEDAADDECPECSIVISQHGGAIRRTVYARDLAPSRAVDWVIAIHGMNTSGAWQEDFNWLLGTTWGRSVPVAVYKYGIVIAGVIMAWRRRKFQRELRTALVEKREEIRARGFHGKPDLIAHSFGTWLVGHLLLDEARSKPDDPLQFGRVILTGCVLRPDYDWKSIYDAGLVEKVMNHFADRDPVVPWAHLTISDSGPSGRRGFDGTGVLNVRAQGYRHSDLFSIEHHVVDGRSFQVPPNDGDARTHLERSYEEFWQPFLTWPENEVSNLPDRDDPSTRWRPLPWPLRGNSFPWVALPMLVALAVCLLIAIGNVLEHLGGWPGRVAWVGAGGVAVLLLSAAAVVGGRWLGRRIWTPLGTWLGRQFEGWFGLRKS